MFTVVTSEHGLSSCPMSPCLSVYCQLWTAVCYLTRYMLNDTVVFCRLFYWGCLKLRLFREVEVVVSTRLSSCRRWERPPAEIRRDTAYGDYEAPIV